MVPTWITASVSMAILIVWVGSFIASLLTQNYTGLTISTPALLILAGYAFGVKIINANKNGKNGVNKP